MKTALVFAFACVCLLSTCDGFRWNGGGWFWGRRGVTYTIRNTLQEPTFELTQTIKYFGRKPFIRIMEIAADRNSSFRFSADYFDKKLGYYVTTINNVTGNYAADKTFWEFLRAPDTFLQLGVSNFWPRRGDHIIFNFTMGGHE